MNRCMFKVLALSLVGTVVVGCTTPTTRVDTRNDLGPEVAAFDYRDVQETAREMLQSLYRSGRLDRPDGNAYVMAIGKITNDTMQRFDTSTITADITESLTESGKVMLTAAMGATEASRDEMVNAVRSVRGNAEFDQSTVAAAGQLVAASLSLRGRIYQRELPMDNGDKQIEYYFQLQVTDAIKGTIWWQKQHKIVKRTDRKTPTWGN